MTTFNLSAQGLKDYLPAGKYIGTAVNDPFFDIPTSNPPEYKSTLKKEFNVIVAENAFKMSTLLWTKPATPLHLSKSDLYLYKIDTMLDFAQKNNMRVRGHTLIWYSFPPSWLSTEAAGWTEQEIYSFAKQYITLVVEHCKGKVQEWDVCNEMIDDQNSPSLRKANTWYANVTNMQQFMDSCYFYAHAADPDAKLFYNDYNIEISYFPKQAFMLNMVQQMVNRGVPLHGVGLQSHFESGTNTNNYTYNEVNTLMSTLNSYNLLCNITELDLRICSGGSNTSEQADEYQNFTKIFLQNTNCNSLLVWGLTDQYSWIPLFFNNCGEALLLNNNFQEKEAYTAVKNELINNISTSTKVLTTPIKTYIFNANEKCLISFDKMTFWKLFNVDGKLLNKGTDKEISISNLTVGYYLIQTSNELIKLVIY